MPTLRQVRVPPGAGAGSGGSQRTHAGAEHMVEALLCPRGLLDLFFVI